MENLTVNPIVEVISGIAGEDFFLSEDEINDFYQNFPLKDKYTKVDPTKTLNVELVSDNQMRQIVHHGSVFSTQEGNEAIIIEPNKIFFLQKKAAYKGFESFLNDTQGVLSAFLEYFKKDINVYYSELRYVNAFKIPASNTRECLSHNPVASCENNGFAFAYPLECSSAQSLKSADDDTVNANIKTHIANTHFATFDVTLDIATNTTYGYVLCHEEFNQRAYGLKKFANNIFYAALPKFCQK